MKKHLLFISFGLSLLCACGGGDEGDKKESRKAKGGVYYGGVFRMNEEEDFRNLYPHNITEVISHRITNQVYEGLVKLDQKDLSVIPAIAEKWEVNDSATVFTFHLRKGVMFHDDPCFPEGEGREVTAKDFKYCFQKLCEASPNNQGYFVFENRVKGATEYYQSTINKKPLSQGVTGIKVIDEYTLQIELEHSFAGFLNILTSPFTWVFPKEAVDKYGVDMRVKCVGTGPFRVKEVKEGEAVILVRNDNYWASDEHGNQLPYLDAIKFSFIKEKKSELLEFRKGNLDMVFRLPIEMIDEVMGELEDAKSGQSLKFEMQVTPALNIQYYGFQHKSDIFKKKELRQAFNYAIDREKLVIFTLQGDATPARHGVVPPVDAFKEYEFSKLKGFTFDSGRAKQLLAKAGYPNGKGFPEITLQLNSGGQRNTQVAEVIQKMLKENLNINVKLNVMPFAQHLENYETGKALFWRTGWTADYPDPESFLNLFYGRHVPADLNSKSYINSVRYQSPVFDSLFALALKEIDLKKRYDLYRQADQVAIDDAAFMPIYHDENTRLLQLNVRNFPQNAMEYRDLTRVYFDRGVNKNKVPAPAVVDTMATDPSMADTTARQ